MKTVNQSEWRWNQSEALLFQWYDCGLSMLIKHHEITPEFWKIKLKHAVCKIQKLKSLKEQKNDLGSWQKNKQLFWDVVVMVAEGFEGIQTYLDNRNNTHFK